MKHSRFFLHPILEHSKSRYIFIAFLIYAVCIGGALWWGVETIISKSGIYISPLFLKDQTLLKILLSPIFRCALILLTVVLATTQTSGNTIGPIRRIEQWLKDIEEGHNVKELEVRQNDQYKMLARLINELHQKTKKQ